MTILTAEQNDLQEILALQLLAFQSEARIHNNFNIPPLKQTIDGIIEEYKNWTFLKAVNSENRIIGSVRVRDDNQTLYVNTLIVHPDFQGQGIGTQLLKEVEERMPQLRYEIFTSDKSVLNIKLYERMGYRIFKTVAIEPSLNYVYLEK